MPALNWEERWSAVENDYPMPKDKRIIYRVENTTPAITTDVGTTVNLGNYSVVFDGDTYATPDAKWTDSEGTVIETFTADMKGVTVITATSGDKTKNIYVVAKEPYETEYVLYETDYSKYTSIDELKAEGYQFPSAEDRYSLTDGNLIVGSLEDSYARLILSEWLGDFGNYSFTTEAKMLTSANANRWFSMVYRMQNANGKYYPYYHTCIRENTTGSSGIEFAERNPSNNWVLAIKTSGIVTSLKDGYHTFNVKAYGDTVRQNIDGRQMFYATDEIIGNTVNYYEKGLLGISVNYSTVALKNVKVTIQENVPEEYKLTIMDNAHEESNLISAIANVQYIGGEEIEISAENLIVKVISGEDIVKYENQQLVATGEGTATVMYGYKTATADGGEYVLYSQPVTVTVTEKGDLNSDGEVDSVDLTLMRRLMLCTVHENEITGSTDINSDNTTNIIDIVALKKIIGK